MQETTITVSWKELTAGLLEKIKSQFSGSNPAAKVEISVKLLDPESKATTNERFEQFFSTWKTETALLSSGTAMVNHPAYQQIIGMGDAVIPFILIKLREDPQHLFYALFKITGENPVPAAHAGDLPKMTADWLAWGKSKGYIF
ncbi:MAG: hypothetical protein IT258_22095 [Saprospiraceae bacterium]|nr:hypothetical protein [Saprospiraceae bacterium]